MRKPLRCAAFALAPLLAASLAAGCKKPDPIEPKAPTGRTVAATERPLDAPAGDGAAPVGGVTSSATETRIEACRLKMTEPASHEWITWWEPETVAGTGEGPSSVHSMYWASRQEKRNLDERQTAMPLDINCSSEGPPEIAVSLAALSSTAADMPLGPGSYPIVGKSSGEVRPGQMLAGKLLYDDAEYDARGGRLELSKFDMEGVAGSFTLEAVDVLNGSRRIRLQGRFDIPCRGGMRETECRANKARAVARR